MYPQIISRKPKTKENVSIVKYVTIRSSKRDWQGKSIHPVKDNKYIGSVRIDREGKVFEVDQIEVWYKFALYLGELMDKEPETKERQRDWFKESMLDYKRRAEGKPLKAGFEPYGPDIGRVKIRVLGIAYKTVKRLAKEIGLPNGQTPVLEYPEKQNDISESELKSQKRYIMEFFEHFYFI